MVKIELTDEEAAFFWYVLAHIGGHPENSVRRHADAVMTKIGSLHHRPEVAKRYGELRDKYSPLSWKDDKESGNEN